MTEDDIAYYTSLGFHSFMGIVESLWRDFQYLFRPEELVNEPWEFVTQAYSDANEEVNDWWVVQHSIAQLPTTSPEQASLMTAALQGLIGIIFEYEHAYWDTLS